MSGETFITSLAGEKMGLQFDIERCRALVGSALNMVKDVEAIEERLSLDTDMMRALLEMAGEALTAMMDMVDRGAYDQEPTEKPTEKEHRA
jgi:hypothetical protein